MRRLLIATTNEGKVRELRALLDGLNVELLSLGQLAEMPAPVEETGETFAENALLKAEYYFARTGITTLADDSGLEVAALGGRPGVRSARYGGEGLGDAERNSLLLAEMVEVAKGMRGARFVCVLALVDATGVRLSRGIVRVRSPRRRWGAAGLVMIQYLSQRKRERVSRP